MTQKPFEDFLKSKADEFHPKPNLDNWDKIAAALPPEKKKKRLVIWIPIGIAACLIALAYGINISQPSFNNSHNKTVKQNLVEQNIASSDSKTNSSETINSSKSKASIQDSKNHVSTTPDNHSSHITTHSNDFTTSTLIQSQKQKEKPYKSRINDQVDIEPFINHIFEQEPKKEITSQLKLGGDSHSFGYYNSDTESYHNKETIDTPVIADNKTKLQPIKDSSTKLKIACILIREYPHRLAFNFTPLYINTILSQPNSIGTNSIEYCNRKNEDKAKFSFNTGLTYVYKIRKHAYSIGAQYTQLSYSMYLTSVTYSPSLSTINRVGNFNYAGDSFITTPKDDAGGRVTNTYRYISIPITYSKYIFDNSSRLRNKFAMQFGVTYNRLISQTGLLNQSNGVYVRPNSSEENNITKQHFSIRTGLEFNQTLSRRSLLFVAPFYQRSLSAIEKGSISTSYAAWGLSFGLQYKLR